LLGGLLAVTRLAVFGYWANSYWGGSVAAAGGALLLGALGRIFEKPRTRDALVMALGLLLLANSRPYEGLIFSLPVAAALAIWLFSRKGPAFQLALTRVILPLGAACMILALGMGYYFWRVTGNPLQMPYQVDRTAYAVTPYFLWQTPRPAPAYDQDALRQFYLHTELDFYLRNRSLGALALLEAGRILEIWLFYIGPVLTLPLVFSAAALPYGISWPDLSKPVRLFLVATLVSLAGLALEVFFFPHYAAPMTALVYALVLLAMQSLRGWTRRGKPVGLFLTRVVPVICILLFALRAGAGPLHLPVGPDWPPTWYNLNQGEADRDRMQAQLEGLPGKHLVLVRYGRSGPGDPQLGWVYNGANIDGSKVVWAWDMGEARNQELIDYFQNRHVWLVRLDRQPRELAQYSESPSIAAK
jgi:hypothetical protein